MARRPVQAHTAVDEPQALAESHKKRNVPPPGTVEAMAHARTFPPKRYTVVESQQQEDAVEALVRSGASRRAIARRLRPPPPVGMGLSFGRVDKLVERVLQRWQEEDSNARARWRSAQVRRLAGYIQEASGVRDPQNPRVWLERPNHDARARYERLLMTIAGTAAPIEVNLNVEQREVLVAVFGQYSLEDLERLHDQAERRHQLAEAYLRDNPEAAIVVEGHAAEE